MLIALPALLAAAIGAALQAAWGDWVDLPPELITAAHAANFTHILLAIAGTLLDSWAGRVRMPKIAQRYASIQQRSILLLTTIAVGTFFVIAFWEIAPFGAVAAVAFFPPLWMLCSLAAALRR